MTQGEIILQNEIKALKAEIARLKTYFEQYRVAADAENARLTNQVAARDEFIENVDSIHPDIKRLRCRKLLDATPPIKEDKLKDVETAARENMRIMCQHELVPGADQDRCDKCHAIIRHEPPAPNAPNVAGTAIKPVTPGVPPSDNGASGDGKAGEACRST